MKKTHWLILIVFLALHFVKVAKILPPSHLFTTDTLTSAGLDLFYFQSKELSLFWDESRTLGGYNPYRLGGRLSFPLVSSDQRAPVFVAFLLRSLVPPEMTVKLFLFLMLWLLPFLLFFTVRQFGQPPPVALMAVALTLMGWANFDPYSYRLIASGRMTLLFSVGLAFFSLGVFFRFLETKKQKWIFYFALSYAGALFLHEFAFFLIPFIVFFFQKQSGDFDFKSKALFWAAWAAAFVVNAFWLVPFFGDSQALSRYTGINLVSGIVKVVSIYVPLQWSDRLPFSVIRLMIVVAGFVGLSDLKKENPRLALFLGGLVTFLIFLSLLGHAPTLVMALSLFSLIMAALAAVEFYRTFWKIGTVRFVVFLVVAWFTLSWQISHAKGLPSIRTGTYSVEEKLGQFVQTHRARGRVLFEDQFRLSRLSALLAMEKRIPVMGTSEIQSRHTEWGAFLQSRFGRRRPLLFGRPVQILSGSDIRTLFANYDIGLVVVHSIPLRYFFDSHADIFTPLPFQKKAPPLERPSLAALQKQGHPGGFSVPPSRRAFRLYQVRDFKSSRLAKGAARLNVKMNRIHLSDASPGELVLKYRWVPSLRTTPAVPIYPVFLDNRGSPFIGLDNEQGLDEIQITY